MDWGEGGLVSLLDFELVQYQHPHVLLEKMLVEGTYLPVQFLRLLQFENEPIYHSPN